MTMVVAERITVDTNILLAATNTEHREHERARDSLDAWPRAGTSLYTMPQILREYLSVATRPSASNGLGMTRSDAVANVQKLRARLHVLTEDAKVCERLIELVSVIDCGGKQIHDANIVAAMLVNGVHTVATLNTEDFTRFGGKITVIAP